MFFSLVRSGNQESCAILQIYILLSSLDLASPAVLCSWVFICFQSEFLSFYVLSHLNLFHPSLGYRSELASSPLALLHRQSCWRKWNLERKFKDFVNLSKIAECYFVEHDIQVVWQKVERKTFFSTIGKNSTAPLHRKERWEWFSKKIWRKVESIIKL